MRRLNGARLAGLIAFVWCASALAFTPGEYNGRINLAVSNVVADKVKAMGYAETDVRFQRQMNAMMKAGRSAMGSGTARRAMGFLFRRLTPVGLVLGLAADMTQTNMDQDQIQLAGAALTQSVVNDPSSGVIAGGSYWSCSGARGGDPKSVAWQCFTVSPPWTTWTFTEYQTGSWTSIRQSYQGSRYHPSYCPSGGCQVTAVYVDKISSGAPITCGKGSYINGSNQCVPYSYTLQNAPTYTPIPKTVEDAAADVKPETAAQPLPDKVVADLANEWWAKTAQEDPEALPWPSYDPIQPSDVSRTKTSVVTDQPTIGDWWTPNAPDTEPDRVPLPQPNGAPTTQPKPDSSTPGQGTQVDFGPDPNTPPPQLDATPTIQQIVGPLLNLMPDLRSFTVPGHSAQCPTAHADWTMFGQSFGFTMSTHCDLMEQNRAVIQAAMLVVWTLCATFIVLRA